jgi:hypothetical protein
MAFGGNHPPAGAQQTIQVQQIPVITNEDVKQDTNIDSINVHLSATDSRIQHDLELSNANSIAIAEMQGEERIFGAILGLLSSGSIILQVAGKRKSDS